MLARVRQLAVAVELKRRKTLSVTSDAVPIGLSHQQTSIFFPHSAHNQPQRQAHAQTHTQTTDHPQCVPSLTTHPPRHLLASLRGVACPIAYPQTNHTSSRSKAPVFAAKCHLGFILGELCCRLWGLVWLPGVLNVCLYTPIILLHACMGPRKPVEAKCCYLGAACCCYARTQQILALANPQHELFQAFTCPPDSCIPLLCVEQRQHAA